VVTVFAGAHPGVDVDHVTVSPVTGKPSTSTALATNVQAVENVGHVAPLPETASSRDAGITGVAVKGALADASPVLAVTVVEPSFSALTATESPDVPESAPTVGSAMDHVTGAFGIVAPFASCTTAEYVTDRPTGALDNFNLITMLAAVTDTLIGIDCDPLAAVILPVMVAVPTLTPRMTPLALTVAT